MNGIFARTERLVGADGLTRLHDARIILFGTGGVGGWCAEALIRSGIGHLTIVDMDCVDVSNVNRQLPATTLTVGQPKVEVLKERLLQINPDAQVTALQRRYEKGADFQLASYDIIIDAIDSLTDKRNLLLEASATPAALFSSMGAARKLDAGRLQVSEFRKVEGCPLARALRQRFKATGRWPEKKFPCVWSPERSAPSGTIAPVVAAFGMRLAGEVINTWLHT